MIRHQVINDSRKMSENTKNYIKLLKHYQIKKLRKEEVDFTNNDDRQTIILVLQNKKERSKLELEYLRRAFKNLKFFQEKKEQLNDKSQLMLYQSLSYQSAPKYTVLFHFGDPGDTYYIILKGSVSILIPNKKHKQKLKSGKLTSEIVRKNFELRKLNFENSYMCPLSPKLQDKNNSNLMKPQKLNSIEDLSQIDINFKIFDNQPMRRSSIGMENALAAQLQRQSIDAFSTLGAHPDEEEKKRLRRSSQIQIKEDDMEDGQSITLEEEIDIFEQNVFPQFQRVKIMEQGEAFGEIALVSNEKRTATVFIREDTEFATINRSSFSKILKAYHDTLKIHKIQDLTMIPCFKKLYPEILEELVQIIEIKSFKFSEIIYKQNHSADYVYFMISGAVELSTTYNNQNLQNYTTEFKKILGENVPKNGGDECIRIAMVTAKQVFGWEEIMNQSKRIYRATALEETLLYFLNAKQFIQLLSECRPFLDYFLNQETILQEHRNEFVDKCLKQKSRMEIQEDKKQARKIQESIKEMSQGMKFIFIIIKEDNKLVQENLKIFQSDSQEQLQLVSHVKNLQLFQNAMINRKQNLKSLKIQSHKQPLKNEPMFPIQAEKVLEKRLSAIHMKYAIIQGESFENKKYKNYIYSSVQNSLNNLTEDNNDENKQEFKSRQQKNLKNLLQIQLSSPTIQKLPCLSDHQIEIKQSDISQFTKPQTIASNRQKGISIYTNDSSQNKLIRKILGSRKEKQISIVKRFLDKKI